MRIGFVFRPLLLLLGCAAALRSPAKEQDAASALTPREGETQLSAVELVDALARLPVFKQSSPLQAGITIAVDDLLGPRQEEGRVLIDPPARVLRKITRPAEKIQVFSGTQIQEYVPALNTVYVKDFAQAPVTLRRLQAAFTGDIKTLREIFDVHAFRGKADGGQAAFRFVLLKKTGSAIEFNRIQARVMEKALFFHEIEFTPAEGDRTVETYKEISAAPKPEDKDFVIEMPADVKRKVVKIPAEGK